MKPAAREKYDSGGFIEESKPLQAGSEVTSPTETRYFLQDRNTLKLSEQQQQPQLGNKLLLFKDEAAQLESFQPLTSQPESSGEFETLQNVRSGLYNPETPEETRRGTQSQHEDLSHEKVDFNAPLQPRYYTPPVSSQAEMKAMSTLER
ncbi:uncharacterized protein si:ch211-140l13.3 isoform X2, partial [Scomber scombrus]